MCFALKRTLLCLLLGILLVDCKALTNAPPNFTPIPTVHATLESLSLPLTETKREWTAGPVIASVVLAPGECFYCSFSIPPESILYSNGQHIIQRDLRLYENFLSKKQVCDLLTEIDRSGFFEYTTAQYEQFYKSNHMKPGPEHYWINVEAWKSNSLYLFSFGFLFSQYKDKVGWPEAIRTPYEKLTEYDPVAMHPYIPERVALHIEKDPDLGFELNTWMTNSPSLDSLMKRYNEVAIQESDVSEGELILTSDEAKAVLQQFNERPWHAANIFIYNQERYLIAIRGLLPYEESGRKDLLPPEIPGPNTNYSTTPINCP